MNSRHFRILLFMLLISVVVYISLLDVLVNHAHEVASEQFLPPSPSHPLGTDQFGRDILARLMSGGKRTLVSAGLATIVAVGLGLILGGVSGGVGGAADWLLTRTVEFLLAFPGILLAMTFAAAFGSGLIPAALGVGIGLLPGFSRIVRSVVRSIMVAPFAEAARSMGASKLHIVKVHLIPNVLPQVMPLVGVVFAWSVLSISALEFLGLAGSPSEASWGRMIAEGRVFLREAPFIALAPGSAITLTTLLVLKASQIPKRKMSPEVGDTFP